MTRTEAKKRVNAKRFLAAKGINFNVEDSTYNLVALARHTQHAIKFGPMTAEKVFSYSDKYPYLNQLFAVKQIWGDKASINFSDGKKCSTVKELIEAMGYPSNLAWLDTHLHLISNRLDLR